MSWSVKQRINFYTEDFKPPQLPEDIQLLLFSVAGNLVLALVLVLAALGYARWEASQLQQEQQQEQSLLQQIEQVMAARPPLALDPSLQQRKDVVSQQLAASRKVLSYLSQGNLQQSYSFTHKVEQLAQQDVAGVWLQRFVINEQGQQVRLQGYVDDPAKLSPYIASLVRRPAYQQVAFRYVDIQKHDDNRWLMFELDSRAREPQDNAAQALSNSALTRWGAGQ